MKTYIKEWMEVCHYTTDKLSQESGIPLKTLESLFAEKKTPSLMQLSAIGDVLDLNLDELTFVDPTKLPQYVIDSIGNSEEQSIYKTLSDMDDPGAMLNVKLYLKEWMDIRGVTYQLISANTSIPVALLEEWATNQKNPSLYQVKVLADLLDITVNDLLSNPQDMKAESSVAGQHVVEVTNFKVARRIQEYLRFLHLDAEIFVTKYPPDEDHGYRVPLSFTVYYTCLSPIPGWKLLLEALNPKYRTEEENMPMKEIMENYIVNDFSDII